MPLHRRLPKRGFTNIFRTEYSSSPGRIAELQPRDTRNSPGSLRRQGPAQEAQRLGQGIGSTVSWQAQSQCTPTKFSKSPRKKIEKAGGKAILVA